VIESFAKDVAKGVSFTIQIMMDLALQKEVFCDDDREQL
jgi:hypothetical protein